MNEINVTEINVTEDLTRIMKAFAQGGIKFTTVPTIKDIADGLERLINYDAKLKAAFDEAFNKHEKVVKEYLKLAKEHIELMEKVNENKSSHLVRSS